MAPSLDALVAKRACCNERIAHGKGLLVRIVSMLTKLVQRFSPPGEVREGCAQYLDRGEDEDEGLAELPSADEYEDRPRDEDDEEDY